MTDDIVVKLRDEAHALSIFGPDLVYEELFALAADEIERLRGLVKDLQTALGPFPLAVNIQCDNPSEIVAHVKNFWEGRAR